MSYKIKIRKPVGFNFCSTVESHGWYDLAPFEYDRRRGILRYVFRDPRKRYAAIGTINETNRWINIDVSDRRVPAEKVERDVRHILRMDDDIEAFHRAIACEPKLDWVPSIGAGRLLRSPSVFEDMVKTLCTTNCSWGLTKKMVENLVTKLGRTTGEKFAFPTALEMAAKGEDFYRNEIKAGYRSAYFVELAETVASGRIDPESWQDPEFESAEIRKEIKSIKGFGDYAADNLMKLIGRYDGLALDSWLRSQYAKKYNRGKACADKKIHKHYEKFGEWKGLVIWCDMTEDWFREADSESQVKP